MISRRSFAAVVIGLAMAAPACALVEGWSPAELAPVCAAGQLRCKDGDTQQIQSCAADGSGWVDGARCTAPRTCGGDGVAAVCGGCTAPLPGPAMVEIDGNCIDTTPVTQQQYLGFLTNTGAADVAAQPAVCQWNPSFLPDTADCEDDTSSDPFDPELTPNVPAVCIDWCDAVAFCAWSGKHLCDSRAGQSLAINSGDVADSSNSAWEFACTQGGTTPFSYGSTMTDACGSVDDALADVASNPTCCGQAPPYSSLFDMNGPLLEWEDACVDGVAEDDATMCRLDGGASCGGAFQADRRDTIGAKRGFRCCAN